MPDVERQRLEFLPGIAERLGWYVYALRNPLTGDVFYVGKGRGDRAYQHARHEIGARGGLLSPKLQEIRAIHRAGREVAVEIIRYDLPDEETAYLVEGVAIDALTIGLPAGLANPIAGHGDRWASLEQLRSLAAPPADIPPEHRPALLIRPRKKYAAGGRGYSMSPDELWEITRGGWTMRRRDYRYAMCVHDGIVRGVWRVTGWDEDEEHWGRGRRGLIGEPAEDLWPLYVGRYVGHLLPPKGGQLPFTPLL
jgi:hypothetical protein